MRTMDELRQQVAFECWANRAQIGSIETVEQPSEDLLRISWHLLIAAENWLSRIDGVPPAVSLEWRTPEQAELPDLLEMVNEHFVRTLGAMSDERLAETFDYKNTAGDELSDVAGDILAHLMLHGAEHRGQIAFEVGRLAGTPAETEYAWFLREQRA